MAPLRVRTLPLVLALAGLVAAGTAAAYLIRQHRDVTTTSEQAWRLYHEGVENDLKMYDREATSSYAEALRFDPHFVMATLRLADHMRARDPERAKSLLASARRYRDDVTARERLLLDIYDERWGRRDLKRLGALFDEYVRRYPKDPEGYRMRCDFLSTTGRASEALGQYEKLIAIDPNYAVAYNTLGYYWASRGDAAKAEDYLKRYRYLAPDQANPFDSIGELYAHTGRYDEAEENLRKALAIKDDFYPSLGHLGTVEAGRGRYAEAAEWFLKAANVTDQVGIRSYFRFLAAMMLVDAGRPDDAVRELDAEAAEIAPMPDSEDTRRLKSRLEISRAALFGRLGRTAEAEKELASADLDVLRSVKEPGASEQLERDLKLVRGVIAMGAGRDAEAVDLLKASLDGRPPEEKGLGSTDYYPGQYFARLALSKCLARLGRADEAAAALAPILQKNPRFAPALEALARIRGDRSGGDRSGGERPAAPRAAGAT